MKSCVSSDAQSVDKIYNQRPSLIKVLCSLSLSLLLSSLETKTNINPTHMPDASNCCRFTKGTVYFRG